MKHLYLAIFVVSAMLPANDLAAAIRTECPEIWNRDEFEAAGGILTITTPPDLNNLPPKKGAGHLHVIVLHDGHVSLRGWDATFGLEATFAVEKRVAKMRYVPPRLKKKPVCVGFDFNWSSVKPLVLERSDATRWER